MQGHREPKVSSRGVGQAEQGASLSLGTTAYTLTHLVLHYRKFWDDKQHTTYVFGLGGKYKHKHSTWKHAH